MADVNLVKSKYTDSDVTSLGELAAADNAKIPGTLQVVGATTLDTDLTVANGGTGASTLTDHGVLVGSGTDAITPLTAGTNGQVLVGSTGADPVFATITDGEGIDTTLGAGTLTIACEDASTSNKGIIEIATTAEDVEGVSSALASTPAGVAAARAIVSNPKAMSQAVNTTYSTTVYGPSVADNANLDNPTNNFAVFYKVRLADWAPSATTYFVDKYGTSTGGYKFAVLTDGKLFIRITSTISATSTVATGLSDGAEAQVGAIITRETASTAGSVIFTVNGVQLGDAVAITAGVPTNLSNNEPLYLATLSTSGTPSVYRYDEVTHSCIVYNRALTAAEVLGLYRNGIAYADKWGSQTLLNTSTIINHPAAPYDTLDGASITGFHVVDDGGDTGVGRINNVVNYALGKKFRVEFDLVLTSGTAPFYAPTVSAGGAIVTGASAQLAIAGHNSYEFTVGADAPTGYFSWYNVSTATEYTVSNFSFVKIGATFALESEGIQPNPGQWLDSSSNKLHAWQPATGSSLTRYKNTFEIRGINTWAGTHGAQSVTMLTDASRAMLPANCYIDEIIGVVAGTTIEDIIVGDGSDTDHWVATTTGLAAGTVSFTIANHISDGTNMEMVVDPDSNFTGTITWTIRGHILD